MINEVKDPVVALVQDNSQSIKSWVDKSAPDYNDRISTFHAELSQEYQVDYYTLGGTVDIADVLDSLSFDQELTNLENIKKITDQYEGANLAALIVASDGIFNQGRNPIYSRLPKNIPIYCIALGDTSKRKDALIKNVYHNNIAYLNDITSIQLDIKADNCAGSLAKVVVEKEIGGQYQKLKEMDVSITTPDFFKTLETDLSLDAPGIAHFRVRLLGISGEEIRANNTKDFFIEVLDARQQIKILADGPHPDLAAVHQLLSENQNYEVEVIYISEAPGPPNEADMVIFHNLPSAKNNIDGILQVLDRKRTPRVFIVGSKTDLPAFNAAQGSVNIKGASGSINEVQAVINNTFSLFTMSDDLKNNLPNFPPLLSPFGEYVLGPSANVLLSQKIGNIDTDYPLIIYDDSGGLRSAVICAEGLWKWKLFDYLERQNFNVIKELLNKTVTYTSIKDDKRKFRVSTAKRVYNENEGILFIAELYNESYELINEGDVFLTLTNSDNDEFKQTFSKKENYYTADIGILAPGRYDYKATTTYNGNQYSDEGSIRVQEIQYELYNLEADHSLLYTLADLHNGSVYNADNLGELSTLLKEDEDMKPILYQYAQNKSVIDFKWLFFALLGFLSLEWFFRRYNGGL